MGKKNRELVLSIGGSPKKIILEVLLWVLLIQ